MAIQTMTITPSLTDDEIVAAINAATDNITRAGSVEPSARPIETDEVGSDEIEDGSVTATDLSATAARDNLKAMGATAREVIMTVPASGEFPVISIERNASGLLSAQYDDVPIP